MPTLDTITPSAPNLTSRFGFWDADADAASDQKVGTIALLSQEVGPSVNVKSRQFGAKGDGVTDDTVAIQAAIDYVADTLGGGVVFLPAGEYRANKTAQVGVGEGKHAITLRSNVALRGIGMLYTIIKPLDACAQNTPILFAAAGDATGIEISHLQVDGNKTRMTTQDIGEDEGINLKTGIDCTIHDCYIHDTAQDGIDLDGGTNINIYNMIIEDCWGSGIHGGGGGMVGGSIRNVSVNNCSLVRFNGETPGVGSNITACIDLKGANGTKVINVSCQSEARAFTSLGSVRVVVSNSNFGSTSTAAPTVWIKGSESTYASDIVFVNCYISGSITSTIGTVLVEQYAEAVRFYNCKFGGKYSIYVVQGGEVIVEGGYFFGVTHAIWLLNTDVFGGGSPRNVSVRNCIFTSNLAGNGVRVDGNVPGQCIDCDFRNTGYSNAGVFLRAAAASPWLIEGNRCEKPLTVVYIISGSAAKHTIQNNILGDLAKFHTYENASTFRNNRVGLLEFSNASATGNFLIGNEIVTSLTPGTASMPGNYWRGNYGAAAYPESGTATLVAGTVTVSSDIVPAGATIHLTRVDVNGSTAIGSLAVGAIVSGTSFVINALDAAAAVETGDTSKVFWEIKR